MFSDKPALRTYLLARRASLALERRIAIAERMAVHAEAVAQEARDEVVAGFWPIRDEIDPRPLLEALHLHNAHLALPVVTKEGLLFRRWKPGDPLVRAGFGLMEPDSGAPAVDPAVMLVPLLGFDKSGGRIGYGKGYYDGAIQRYRPRLTIGLAFACQEVDSIPLEPHDQRLFQVLTEDGLIDCRATSRD